MNMSPSLTTTLGAFSLNLSMSETPTGAAAAKMSRMSLKSSGVAAGLAMRKPRSGGATCRKLD